MSTSQSSQELEAYLPVYDTVPEKWEESREFLIEQLKKISNAVNLRTIGWMLDEELLSGQSFIPSPGKTVGSTASNYRSVLRKVVSLGTLGAPGVVTVAHGINFDTNFTLIDLWAAVTDIPSLKARRITGNDVVMGAVNLTITSPQAFTRGYCVVEYCQEL